MSSSSESHGTHDLNAPATTAPQVELVERLQTDASYLSIKSGSYPVIAKDCAEAAALIQSQAAEIERLTREKASYLDAATDANNALISAEADLARALEALAPFVKASIDVTHTAIIFDSSEALSKAKRDARAALPNTTGEAE